MKRRRSPAGRKPLADGRGATAVRVLVRLTPSEARALDAHRGAVSRAEYLRRALPPPAPQTP